LPNITESNNGLLK